MGSDVIFNIDDIESTSDLLLNMVENMESMVRVIDHQDRIVFMNRRMREEFGDQLGKRCNEMLCQPEKCAECVSMKCKSTKKAEGKDIFINGKYYRVIASPLLSVDGMGSAVEIFHDITEQKLLEVDTARHYAKLKADIDFAKNVQQRAFPKDGVYNNAIRLTSAYLPSEDLGGDLYDLVRIDENRILFYVADVSGHGIRSSLFTIFLRQVVRGMRDRAASLTDLINELIRSYEDLNTDGEQYFSFLAGLYDKTANKLTLINAGHNCLPLLLRADGSMEEVSVAGLPICSLLTEACHEEVSLSLHSGDRILICTDGVTEAYNRESNQYFSYEGFLNVVSSFDGPKEDLCSRIISAAQTFAGHAPDDDMTVMMLEVL
ncbi:MAG: SpoIIE family protein phosphatase [Firmicutes bacterium]|nr:SpoIIE family protein phosphatase [Bacillota bacterium]